MLIRLRILNGSHQDVEGATGKNLSVTNPNDRKIMSLDLQNWVTFTT